MKTTMKTLITITSTALVCAVLAFFGAIIFLPENSWQIVADFSFKLGVLLACTTVLLFTIQDALEKKKNP